MNKKDLLLSLSRAVIVLKHAQKQIDDKDDRLHDDLQIDINNIYTCCNIIESIEKIDIN